MHLLLRESTIKEDSVMFCFDNFGKLPTEIWDLIFEDAAKSQDDLERMRGRYVEFAYRRAVLILSVVLMKLD